SSRESAVFGSASCPSPRARARASSAQPFLSFALQALRKRSAARASLRRTPSPSRRRFPSSSQAAALPALQELSSAAGLAAASSKTARIMGCIYRDSVVRGHLPRLRRLFPHLVRDRAVLGEEPVQRALHVVRRVELGSDPAE